MCLVWQVAFPAFEVYCYSLDDEIPSFNTVTSSQMLATERSAGAPGPLGWGPRGIPGIQTAEAWGLIEPPKRLPKECHPKLGQPFFFTGGLNPRAML